MKANYEKGIQEKGKTCKVMRWWIYSLALLRGGPSEAAMLDIGMTLSLSYTKSIEYLALKDLKSTTVNLMTLIFN